MFKKSLGLIALVLFAVLAKKFCYRQTDGFALCKIVSDLSPKAEWAVPPLPPEEQKAILHLLDQPFHYLARGAQSFVFVSEDGQTVIKFFRIHRLRPPQWLNLLQLPFSLQPMKLGKLLRKQAELATDFQSYVIAYQEMKEETGLLYLHLNKTTDLHQKITIHDRLNIAYELDLDQTEFLVQKRATLVYPYIEALIQKGQLEAAQNSITNLVQLLHDRYKKGIFDKDPDLNTNFGFIDQCALQIDIGRFRNADSREDSDEILRITDNFRQWLDKRSPQLSSHLLQEIETIRNEI